MHFLGSSNNQLQKKETIEGTKTVRQALVARSRYPVSVFRAVEKYVYLRSLKSIYIIYIVPQGKPSCDSLIH